MSEQPNPLDVPVRHCGRPAPHLSHKYIVGRRLLMCVEASTAVPEPRSTPGPSTGTPEPSQAASEARGVLDGATEPPPEYAWPATPGEFAALWNAADDDRRARMVEWLVANGEAAVRCFMLNHDGAVAELRHLGGEVARLREALERVRALADIWTTWDYLMGSDFPPLPHDGPGYAKALQSILASVDAPAPEEADDEEVALDVSPHLAHLWADDRESR